MIPNIEAQLDDMIGIYTYYGMCPDTSVQDFVVAKLRVNKRQCELRSMGYSEDDIITVLMGDMAAETELAFGGEVPEPCGYCGSSSNPNDICEDCWNSMNR